MSFETKSRLNNYRFEQLSGETLTLSGITEIHGLIEIKNGGSLIISGGTLVSDNIFTGYTATTNTTINGILTDLGTGYKGGASDLAQRLSTISNFASPNAGGIISGQFYDNSFHGTASSTLIGAANRIDLAPYYTSVSLSINQIGVAVSTAVAASLVKIVIYSSDSNGWANTLLYESGDIDTSTTGYKFAALSFTFNSGIQYWVGVRHSSTATLRTINVSSAVNLGLITSAAANYATILRRTLTFATGAPATWSFVNGDRVANVTPPSIRFRAV